MSDKGIRAKKDENFSEWYTDVITKSELMDYSEVSGCMIFRPLAYSLWENIKGKVDQRFKNIGIENTYFPLFIPESSLEREAEHFEGFNPEVAWVTETGSSELEERLAIRPTSEAIMYKSYSKWIRSWRDLPMRLNQWNNVVRWEFKHPTPFLRSREFLWNEGHSVFANEEQALEDRDKVLEAYREVTEKCMALPGYMGRKTQKEKFAGAVDSYSIEHLMPDGKAIQGPDYHYDGTNFSKAFDIKFEDQNNEEKYAHQGTFAITTREIGVMISIHSDDKGLVLPPEIAQKKTVIIPIFQEDNKKEVIKFAEKVSSKIGGSYIDDREEYTPGWKFHEWEIKGVPLRLEIGPNEMEDKEATLVRRDTGEKSTVKLEKVGNKVKETLENIQRDLYENAEKFMQENTRKVENYEELKENVKNKGGFVKTAWCGSQECEDQIKEETGAKITNIPFKYDTPEENCVFCGEKAEHYVHFARSY